MIDFKKNIEVLKIIIDKIGNQKVNWILSGSTSLFMQGVDIPVNDIDILTDKRGD